MNGGPVHSVVPDYTAELEHERAMKDRFMAHHVESPFVAESVPGFRGLHYFPIDPALRVPATLERRPVPEEAYLRTNRDGQATMRYVGDLRFELDRRPLRLRVYHAGEGVGTSVFVPFRDSTSGSESYGPGRYLTIDLNETDEYELDFNRAFNPYCAYTDAFECGFPPAENDLPVPVRGGEKVWSEERNPATPNTAVRDLLRPRPAPSARSTKTARTVRRSKLTRRRSSPARTVRTRPRASPARRPRR